jgi:hypothetical protein
MDLGASPRGALLLKDITKIWGAYENDDLTVIVMSAWGELVMQTKFPRERNYWIAGLRALCGVKSAYESDPREIVAWPVSRGQEPPQVVFGSIAQREELCRLRGGVTSDTESRPNSQAQVNSLLKRARVVWQ